MRIGNQLRMLKNRGWPWVASCISKPFLISLVDLQVNHPLLSLSYPVVSCLVYLVVVGADELWGARVQVSN